MSQMTTTISTNETHNPFQQPGIHIEAIRGHQGDRQMYLLLVTNSVLLRNFAAEAEVVDHAQRVQRTLDKRHYHDIVTYLVENSGDYVLGAMTYATDMVTEDASSQCSRGSNIGTLILPMNAKLRCLDGQHRRAAIADAVLRRR